MKLSVIISFLFIFSLEPVLAQNAYVRLGKQAFMDGDFKSAVKQLERACLIDSTNATSLFMLGYSYFHSDNYTKSITAFSKELAITPTDADAYYYRALAKSHLGKDKQASAPEREKYLIDAIFDYTKAIEINPNDSKIASCYQNRGLAYRDYGFFKSDPSSKAFDKLRSIRALRASIDDLEKVLSIDPSRAGVSLLIDQVKDKLANGGLVRH